MLQLVWLQLNFVHKWHQNSILNKKGPYYALFQVHTCLQDTLDVHYKVFSRFNVQKNMWFFSYCPLLQQLYSPSVWRPNLLWLVDSHMPEKAPHAVFLLALLVFLQPWQCREHCWEWRLYSCECNWVHLLKYCTVQIWGIQTSLFILPVTLYFHST